MHYFLDFDRTIFDTPAFKRAFKSRPSISELLHQLKEAIAEAFSATRSLSRRRIFTRTLGTYFSHGRFFFVPEELRTYLYPDAVKFFGEHAKECSIVTYGVQAFITAKVTSALADLSIADVVYTHRKKGPVIRRLTENQEGPFIFIDDAHFQLESVSKACPKVQCFEIRRDGNPGDGRWPVISSLDDLEELLSRH